MGLNVVIGMATMAVFLEDGVALDDEVMVVIGMEVLTDSLPYYRGNM